MSDITKKVIRLWDGGIKTSPRDNNPLTSNGAQMVKGYDIYKDSNKLVPMQSWEDFTTTDEKALGIRAIGGASDTIYGVGSAIANWYGKDWAYRLKVNIKPGYHLSSTFPYHFDMSTLPSGFWNHANDDMSDVRITKADGITQSSVEIENLDIDAQTGDMWLKSDVADFADKTFTTVSSALGTGTITDFDNTTYFAYAAPFTASAQIINFLSFKVETEGNPPNPLKVSLYTNVGGTPGTLVALLGSIPPGAIDTGQVIRDLAFSNQSVSGNYFIVFTSVGVDTANYYKFEYGNTGTSTIYKADNSGLTSWTVQDSTSTPYLVLKYLATAETEEYFYIYYGNPDVDAVPYGDPTSGLYRNAGRLVFTGGGIRFAYTFGDEIPNNKYFSDGETGEAFTEDPQLYEAGYFGKCIRTFDTEILTDEDDEIGLTSSDIGVSFMLYCTGWEDVDLVSSGNGDWTVSLDTNGKIKLFVDGDIDNTIVTSTLAVTTGKWHTINCTFDSDSHISIDILQETFDINDGNYDGTTTNETVNINTGNFCKVANVFGLNNNQTQTDISAQFYNYFYTDFFTIGTEEEFVDVSPQYDGVQLYTKSISSGGWEEAVQSGSPVKSLSYYPVNGFVDDTGTYFVVNSVRDDGDGLLYLAKVDFLDILIPNHLDLGFAQLDASKIAIQSEVAIDGTEYFNDTGTILNSVGDPGSASEFTAVSQIQSLAAWRTYLAIASVRRNIGYINIWDLASSLSTEKVNTGTGNIRIVGNASDTLFCVVDNFIDDAIRSGNKPTMEVKQYIGNGSMETTHIIDVPAVIDDSTYIDYWEKAVSNFKLFRNEQTLFYARLPRTSDADTFNEGFWAVGKNSEGKLSLSLMIDTEGLGMPENIFGFAQQVFFIQKDGGIKRLSDNTYSNTALFTTLKMNEGNTEREKKLHGVEIITEPLDEGQTISIYYKLNGDATRTKIGDFTGTTEISKEFLYDNDGNNLRNYKEIEFDVESTRGSACPLEFNYRYQYLNDQI